MKPGAAQEVTVWIDGRATRAVAGSTVAAVLAANGIPGPHRSPTGAHRGPLCGMGICFECRVTLDGRPHRLACQELCREGLHITTAGTADA
jgi:predicted molibdopterin-dependent oxidoreductase YjgC